MQVEIKPHPMPFVKAALSSLGISILCSLLVLPILFSGSQKYDSGLMIPWLRETDLLGMHLRHRKVFRWTAILLVLVFLIACAMIPWSGRALVD